MAPGIIDTNVNLFDWPFRKLKYGETAALVAKLRRHRVIEAWAGSYEALFHKDINGVNARLAAECQAKGDGVLIPFGSVNLAWPDWAEDLRRCHEDYRMAGIRIFPGYQPFELSHPALPDLLAETTRRGLIFQIVFAMEDPRVHHPKITVGPVRVEPLIPALKRVPAAKVELLHFSGSLQGDDVNRLMAETSAVMDISRLEGNGGLGRLLGTAPGDAQSGAPGQTRGQAPLDRVVFGSHAPFYPLETALLKLVESPLTESQLLAIVQGNARRLRPVTTG